MNVTRWFLVAVASFSIACGRPPSGSPDAVAGGSPAASTPQQKSEPDDPYEKEIRNFQHEREAALKTDTGWLTIAGLFFLTQPRTSFGSDPLNDIVLPPAAPAKAGTFELRDGHVHLTAAPGVTFQLDGKPVTNLDLKSDADGPPDRVSLGDLQLWVHMSGGRLSIRLRDKNSQLRREFTGTSWFPIDKAYRVDAEFKPYAKPKTLQVPNILGDIDSLKVPGIVSFTLNGQNLTMEPVVEGDEKEFWFIFRDLTSGKETYAAARFMYLPLPVNGHMTIDFNRAENPPCAYNAYTTCPLPPEQNRLRVRIEAGEKTYTGQH